MSLRPPDDFVRRVEHLGLPHLGGRRVLVVGPDAGLFGGFARFQHASAIVVREHLDGLGATEPPFDVVVRLDHAPTSSSLGDQIAQLVSLLSPEGLLICESTLGPAPGSAKGELDAVLRDYAVKQIGAPHVHPLLGTGYSRVVHHVALRKPVACLLMAPPGFGKSSLARQVFARGGAQLAILGADTLIHRIARGEVAADEALTHAIRQDFSPLRIDEAVDRIVGQGLLGAWVDAVVREVGGDDFVLDGYIPAEWQAELADAFRDRGYLPVRLDWGRPRPAAMSMDEISRELAAYAESGGDIGPQPLPSVAPGTVAGNLDAVNWAAGGATLRGWAVTDQGRLPERFEVRQGREVLEILRLEVEDRPDVREHLGLPHGRIGFRLVVGGGRARGRGSAGLAVKVADEQGTWHGPLHRSV